MLLRPNQSNEKTNFLEIEIEFAYSSPIDYHQYEEKIRNLEYENRELRAEVRRIGCHHARRK